MKTTQYFEKKIETTKDLIDFLYNHGVGSSKEEIKNAAGNYQNVTLALMEIFKNLNFPLDRLKVVLAGIEGNTTPKTTEEFLSFYCSYVNQEYLLKLYEVLSIYKFESFVKKLSNIQQILNNGKIKENLYVTKVLTKALNSQIKEKAEKANKSLEL